jgi:hypothetical protein
MVGFIVGLPALFPWKLDINLDDYRHHSVLFGKYHAPIYKIGYKIQLEAWYYHR